MKNKAVSLRKRLSKKLFVPITLFPAILVLGLYTYYPSLNSLFISFFKTRLFSITEFVGLGQYKKILTDSLFWKGVSNTIVYSFWSIILSLVIGLLLALLLNTSIRVKGFFRTVFFAPYIIPMAAHTLLWYWMYDPRYGLVNVIIGWLGGSQIPWLTSRDWVMIAFIIMDVWKRVGFNMVLFSSGLATIPDELHEAGRVDGANALQRFWHVTLPMLRPITLFSVIMAFLHTFQLFTEPFVMTKGGPGNASTSVVYQIYVEGFRTNNVGAASAMAVILFIIIFIFTALVMRKFDVKEL